MVNYLVLDVFTKVPFGGNQLAVIPDARALPEAQLQQIAREFNFSETCFLYPPEDDANSARVRIFTPTMEIPFAGHPTIGTAVVLAQAGLGPELVLELGVGPIRATANAESAAFQTSVPLEIMAEPQVELVARALGLSSDDICTKTHVPTLASVGLPFTITELESREALARAVPDTSAFREGAARYEGGLDFAQFAYVRRENHVDARMFAPLDNIPEDPATGSACAAFGALLHALSGAPLKLDILQGEDMGRPSEIGLKATTDGVEISGSAVCVMTGQLVL